MSFQCNSAFIIDNIAITAISQLKIPSIKSLSCSMKMEIELQMCLAEY